MASTDALPVPRKNVAYRVTFPILDADGDLVTGATGLDSEISKDAGTFADCTNEATEIATSSGMYYLDLTSTEMNADCVALIIKTSSSGAKTTPIVLYPEEAGDMRADVTHFGGTAGTFSGGRPEVNTTHAAGTAWGSGAITAASIANGAIDAATFAADCDAEFLSYLVDDATRIDASALNTATGTTIPAILDDTDLIDDGTSGLAKIATDVAAILVDTAEIGAAGAGLTALASAANLSIVAGYIDTEVASILAAVDTEIATIVTHLTDIKGASWTTTDTLEAIRDRGDAAWITATGFSTHSAADVWAVATRSLTVLDEDSTTLDLDATIRAAVGLASANIDTQIADLPTNAELATAITTGLTSALTEGYRGTGATGSVRDLLYEIIAHMGESSISSTTKTLKKIDGSTTAKTYTLDSAVTPTSITEAT